MSNTRNGGRSALAGYLYQIVGVLGMKAWAHCSNASSDSEELEALLKLVRNGELRHEHLGQDAALQQLGIDSDDECALVQFKFSRQIPPKTIGPADLLEIIDRLNKSAAQARNLGLNVTGYVLVTNRALGEQAQELKEAVDREERPTSLRSTDQHRILQQLRVVTPLPLSKWEEALRCFARQFGAEETEIESGINGLIGDLVRQTAEADDASITKDDLTRAFTECQDTRPITLESVAELSTPKLEHFFERLGLQGEPVRRGLLDEIERATSQRALVVLHGLGGCGKTVALWQWAQEMSAGSHSHARASTAISAASHTPSLWITKTICEWANLPANHRRCSEEAKRALARLRTANPNTLPPIMCLGLDGLDEGIGTADQEHIVREILCWFWEEDQASRRGGRPPLATLLVTCRAAQEILQKWLRLDLSGFGYRGEGPKEVEIVDFSPEELLRAARVGLPALCGRIEEALRSIAGDRPESQTTDQEPLFLGTTGPYTSGADEQILEVLMHPAMWRALLELEPDVQSRVLDGEPQALQQLAAVFIRRFCDKVLGRGRPAGLRQNALFDVLCTIARHCRDNGQVRQSMSDWCDPACSTSTVNRQEARTLYSEAVSGGVVLEDDPRHWRWRHTLVWSYLAAIDMSW